MRVSVGVILVGVAISLVGLRSSPASVAASPFELTQARVCPYELFSRRLERCTKDMRDTPLHTNKWVCSVEVVAKRPTTLATTASFDGGEVKAWGAPELIRPHTFMTWFSYSIGTNLPIPGGHWTCTFTLGSAEATVAFTTDGPTGKAVDFTVCSGHDTIGTYKNGICKRDESDTGLPPTNLVVCSLYIPRHPGSVPGMTILDSQGKTIGNLTGQPLQDAIGPFWIWLFAPDHAKAFARGMYTCRASLNGLPIASKSFTVN